MRLERDSFELSELAHRWRLSDAEIRYLVSNGKLQLSVRLIGKAATVFALEHEENGEPFRVPIEETMFTGLADLALRDAFGLVREGEVSVTDFWLPDNRRVTLHDNHGLRLAYVDLLVRRAHAEALDRELLGFDAGTFTSFDFRLFVYDETEFAFTAPQVHALEFMLAQTRDGVPDQHFLDIIEAVGSASQRLSSLFSRKPLWSRLLKKTAGRRGWYHLDPDFVIWLITNS
jgi:hypothetical protein